MCNVSNCEVTQTQILWQTVKSVHEFGRTILSDQISFLCSGANSELALLPTADQTKRLKITLEILKISDSC